MSELGPEEGKPKKARGMPTVFTFLLVLLGLILLMQVFDSSFSRYEQIGYNEFLRHLYHGEVETMQVKGHQATGRRYEDDERGFEVDLPTFQLQRFEELLDYSGWPVDTFEEGKFLERLADADARVAPVRAWAVPAASGSDVFVDYFDAGRQRMRIRLLPDGESVDMQRLQEALQPHDVDVEIKSIAGSFPAKENEEAVEGVTYKTENTLLMSLVWSILPWIVIIAVFWFLLFRQMRSPGGAGGVLSFGRARPAMVAKDRTGVSFDDVAGVEEAKDEVREIVEFLKDPTRFSRIGARIPRGVLLVGRPGTGKTLLARAIAGEANVPFFSISGSDFVEMFVGVGASRVRDLFRQAREKSPCLIFLDEIDAVGRRRGSGLGGGHDEREQTLNAILVEMDGFETDEGIILIAATNRPDVLDPALLRPGRFDRQVVIDLPDVHGREAILEVHTRNVQLEPSVDLQVIARATPGFSGAELASLVNEAALQTVLGGRERVSLADLEEARDRVRFGREKSARVMDEKEKRITAVHEAGHALVGALAPGVEPLHKVTIIPRGMALGATMTLPEKDRYHQRREEVLGLITFAYGGRIAEEMVFGDVTSGAYDDIRRATEMARTMVCQWGMSQKLGPVSYAERDDSIFLGNEVVKHRNYSEETARAIDQEVRAILDECYTKAHELVTKHRDKLDTIAEALMTYEIIHGEEVADLMAGKSAKEARERFERSRARPATSAVKDVGESERSSSKVSGQERFSGPEGDLPAGEPAVS